ncbi:MAG: glycoside hydrolase family 38 C-terminal domain-containing protein, partial [Planctomycetota bacterium]
NRFRILFHAEDLPATGYKAFRVKWTEKDLYPYPHEDWDPLRIHHTRLSTGPRSAENEHVRLEIADNGTLNVKHKDSGEVYRGLHYFMDSGESGNLYMHKPPEQDEMVTSLSNRARISRTVDGPLKVSFEIETVMDLPHYYDSQGNVRSESRREVPVTSTVSLRRGSPVIEVETEVDNRVKDHFLRVCFPTEINAEWTEAGAVFNVERYPTARSRNGEFEGHELKRHQQHGFMDISDGERGFAVLNPTVRDYEILDADRGTIAHSLIRGVNLRIPVDNRLWKEYPGDESAQSPGHHVFRYGLMPHSGDWSEAGVDKEAEKFRTPIRLGQIGSQEGGLPLSKGFFKVEGQSLQFSALKKAEGRDTLLARIYNPTKNSEEGVLQFGTEIKEAHLVNLDEERQEQIEVSNTSEVQVDVPSGRIITVEVVPTGD